MQAKANPRFADGRNIFCELLMVAELYLVAAGVPTGIGCDCEARTPFRYDKQHAIGVHLGQTIYAFGSM